ncbi:MAG: regulatory protein GemA [Melioribacteraceae bacterium]|nr:regulatory protein GemA [Melioribacteraceae bacterium]
MASEKEISKSQITKIHIAKSELGLTDQQYRDALSGFVDQNGEPCSSCKDLNYKQAEVLLDVFRERGFREKRKSDVQRNSNYGIGKYDHLAGRDSKFASVAQLELIDGRWFNHPYVKEKTDSALNNFIRRVAKVDHISFLLKADVKKVIKAIEVL